MNDLEYRFVERFKEPSSWVAVASGLVAIGVHVPDSWIGPLSMVLAGVCAMLGFLLPERK